MINSYKKSILNLHKNNIHNKSNVWQKMIANNFDSISLDKIENFRNNGIGRGHDNSFKMDRSHISKKLDLKKNNLLLNKYLDLLPYQNENYGNLKNYILYKNKILDYFTIDQLHFFDLIYNNFLIKKKFNYLLEIGSGYGWLSRMILKKFNKIKYFIIDLPETNLLCNYYLKENFKDLRIFNYALLDFNVFDDRHIENYDIFILPPFVEIKKIKFDIIINRNSMMEMEKNEIKKYFDLIHNSSKKNSIFINQNRYYTHSSGFRNYFYKYPYDEKWKVIYSKPSIEFRRLHLLVTEKTDIDDSSISREIQNIKVLTKNHSPFPFLPLFLIKIYQKLKKYVFAK